MILTNQTLLWQPKPVTEHSCMMYIANTLCKTFKLLSDSQKKLHCAKIENSSVWKPAWFSHT